MILFWAVYSRSPVDSGQVPWQSPPANEHAGKWVSSDKQLITGNRALYASGILVSHIDCQKLRTCRLEAGIQNLLFPFSPDHLYLPRLCYNSLKQVIKAMFQRIIALLMPYNSLKLCFQSFILRFASGFFHAPRCRCSKTRLPAGFCCIHRAVPSVFSLSFIK